MGCASSSSKPPVAEHTPHQRGDRAGPGPPAASAATEVKDGSTQPGPRFSVIDEDDATDGAPPPVPPRASAADSSLCAAPQLYEPAQGLAAMKDKQRGQPSPRFSIVVDDDADDGAAPPVPPRASAP